MPLVHNVVKAYGIVAYFKYSKLCVFVDFFNDISALLLCICFMLLQLLTTVLDLNVAIFYVKVV